jgi:hypothetical protein
MNTLIVPPEPAGLPGSEAKAASIIIFATLFYQA